MSDKIAPPSTVDVGGLIIDRGSHANINEGACVMELVSFLAGEKWSDEPRCCSLVLTKYLQNLNDSMPSADRQTLRDLVPLCIGTNTGVADEQTRGFLAGDWVVREYIPAWLELAGIIDIAATLRGSPVIDSWDRVIAVTETLRYAARVAAGVWDQHSLSADPWANVTGIERAAWIALGASIQDAPGVAALVAAHDAAWVAGRCATRDASRSAPRDSLAPAVARLQSSAIDLARRMALVRA